MRRQIKETERRMRPHHALFGGVEGEEVSVSEQDIHHD
jgi:hypothetical protein